MTMRTCLAKTIPALWFSLLALAALTASTSPQTKHAPAKKAPAKRAAAKSVPARASKSA